MRAAKNGAHTGIISSAKKDRGGLDMKPVVVDLFCGIGGFSEGAKLAGLDVVLAVDCWAEALKVHAANHPDTRHELLTLGGTVTLERVAELIRLVVDERPYHLHGSPPCQELSTANPNGDPLKGLVLVDWFLDLVKELKPPTWSMEQVKPVIKYLPNDTYYQTLNAADFGVPQTRDRVYAGYGWAVNKIQKRVSVIEALPHLPGNFIESTGSNSKRKCDKQVGPRIFLNTVGASQSIGKRSLSNERSIDEPAQTIKNTTPTLRTIKPEVKKLRSLTLEECLVIQGFSSEYDLSTARLKRDKWTMIGNAVCPPVAAAVLNGILKPVESLKHWL